MTFIRFTLDDLDALADAMGSLVAAGGGWVNAMPAEAGRAALSSTRSVPGMIFGRIGGRGPAVPRITWTAPELRRNRTAPAQLGIEHPAGPRAARRLAEADHAVPVGWAVLQDHALRGLVVALGATEGEPGADPAAAITWAVRAAEVLAGDQGPTWQAQVFGPT